MAKATPEQLQAVRYYLQQSKGSLDQVRAFVGWAHRLAPESDDERDWWRWTYESVPFWPKATTSDLIEILKGGDIMTVKKLQSWTTPDPEEASSIWDFEKGPLSGTYVGSREVETRFGDTLLHEVRDGDGALHAVWGRQGLNPGLEGKEGASVTIERLPTKTGQRLSRWTVTYFA